MAEMTEARRAELTERLLKDVQRVAKEEPTYFCTSDFIRQVKHAHLMDGDYDGCIVYFFPFWHEREGAAMYHLDTSDGYINAHVGDIIVFERYEHAQEVSDYWEEHFRQAFLS